jgi:hypothetical protein
VCGCASIKKVSPNQYAVIAKNTHNDSYGAGHHQPHCYPRSLAAHSLHSSESIGGPPIGSVGDQAGIAPVFRQLLADALAIGFDNLNGTMQPFVRSHSKKL